MSRSHNSKITLLLLGVTFVSGTCAAADVSASNSLPNPYRAIENWAQLPAGVQWGQVIQVQPDAHGNIWVFHRSDPPILEFDATGKLLKSFGAGMFVQAHGLTIDRKGDLWVTDAQGKNGKGQQVFKLSPEGK